MFLFSDLNLHLILAVSFCRRPVPLYDICGSGSGPTYSFSLGIPEHVPLGDVSLLPKGMHLDFPNGTLYGTPSRSAKPGEYILGVCYKRLLATAQTREQTRLELK